MLEKITSKFGLMGLKVKYHAPEIYLAGGIAAGMASVVMVAKAHKDSEYKLENAFGMVEAAGDYYDEEVEAGNMTKAEKARKMVPEYSRAALEVGKVYGPGVLMGITSLALILASHGMLKRRNQALMATVAVIERGFSEYRKRVVSELGEEADERFYYGAESRKITAMEKDADGKTKKKSTEKNHIPETPSPIMYQRIFDDSNQNWSTNSDLNEFFLRAVMSHMNDLLYMKKYLMLNEVYRNLGFKETGEGAVVGWAYGAPGDDFVDFGLDNDINHRPGDDRWFLDFNVNGVVFEYIS